MTYEFDVIEDLGPVGDKGKSLKVIKWGNGWPKFDFRSWRRDEAGNLLPGKGITFTEDEARDLIEALEKML